ncbi:carbonic anhydrase [Halosegnis rubeus]|uniref:carbonic anhydrase n=1 Tax=Halosegnis rubeus TaxID=2212850 RepID=A0A5N5UJ12_9EURY|nr:carbonic anhydrase [Halosegnis rubeus]KAB7518688.1 IcfA [Halosegnis rubeus]
MDTLASLLAGNRDHAKRLSDSFDHLQEGQQPDAVTVCCSDSRVLQADAFGTDQPGEVFTVGNIGNRVVQVRDDATVVSGDVLYPLVHTDTKTAVVLGHTGCGAVTATYDALTGDMTEPPGIEHCIDLLAPRLADGVELLPHDLDRAAAIDRLVEYNVDAQISALSDSPHVPDDVTLAGCVYDFQDRYGGDRGEIHVINVDGERDPETLSETHPEIASRVSRYWSY